MRITFDLGNGTTKWIDLDASVGDAFKSSDPKVVEQAKADIRKGIDLMLMAAL